MYYMCIRPRSRPDCLPVCQTQEVDVTARSKSSRWKKRKGKKDKEFDDWQSGVDSSDDDIVDFDNPTFEEEEQEKKPRN